MRRQSCQMDRLQVKQPEFCWMAVFRSPIRRAFSLRENPSLAEELAQPYRSRAACEGVGVELSDAQVMPLVLAFSVVVVALTFFVPFWGIGMSVRSVVNQKQF